MYRNSEDRYNLSLITPSPIITYHIITYHPLITVTYHPLITYVVLIHACPILSYFLSNTNPIPIPTNSMFTTPMLLLTNNHHHSIMQEIAQYQVFFTLFLAFIMKAGPGFLSQVSDTLTLLVDTKSSDVRFIPSSTLSPPLIPSHPQATNITPLSVFTVTLDALFVIVTIMTLFFSLRWVDHKLRHTLSHLQILSHIVSHPTLHPLLTSSTTPLELFVIVTIMTLFFSLRWVADMWQTSSCHTSSEPPSNNLPQY